MKPLLLFAYLLFCLISCNEQASEIPVADRDTVVAADSLPKDSVMIFRGDNSIDTKNVLPGDVVAFAKTMVGVPYKYASSDPKEGFDCSGFITYVFNHFKIEVPRSSVDFTNVGMEVDKALSKPGDLILFTGTDTLETKVGHMGIVTENTDSLRFIHSTSGKKYGVTVTALNEYYLKRFVKVIRVF